MLLGLLVACGFDSSSDPNSGSGLGGASAGGATSNTGPPTNAATRTSGKTSTVEDEDDGEVGPSATNDSQPMTSGVDSADSDPSGTGAGPPREEALQNAPQTECSMPFWCFDTTVFDPAGGPIWIYECFTSSLEPPLTLTELNFIVPVRPPELGDVHLQVTEWAGDLPGTVVYVENEIPIVQGANTVVPGSPAVVDAQRFCVGLHAPGFGLSGALGVAVDTTSVQVGISFVQSDGLCQEPLRDLLTLPEPTPPGNWCLDVRVSGY